MELELNHLIEKINKDKLKRACIQLPDGLKPQAKAIQQKITEKTDAEVLMWLGSCFGACDIPEEIKKLKIDLLVQFGH
ncbi:diphthamide synthesis protein [Candidatus Woesearchaeota archaeon]|nr:diphthamide synthesis protein [Candidatus Woesearchaeota archaeon]